MGRHGEPAGFPGAAAGEAERLVGWLRVLAIALIGAGQGLEASSPTEEGFIEAIAAFSAWSVVALVWVHVRPVTARFALVSTIVDVAAITALALLSGGAFSQARLAYLLVPIAVAFRFRPVFTALASVAVIVAYLAQALADPAASRPNAGRFIAVYAGYLAWVGLAACLLSYVLGRRTRRVTELAVARQRLMAEALTAEERERKALAEGLHDHAIQNLLSARHDLEEAAEERSSPPLQRADEAIGSTIGDLREAIFELHPYVLEEAGLAAALRAMGQRAARRAGFRLHVDLDESDRYRHDRLLVAVARELLANIVEHAEARNVWVRLGREGTSAVLSVRDDGRGFDLSTMGDRLADGHIGLASQRERVTSAGGEFEVASTSSGTTVEVRLPLEGGAQRSP